MELETTTLMSHHEDDDLSLDDEIAVIRGEIWDNCRDFCRKCDVVLKENEFERVTTRCPKCGKVMGFMPKAGIGEYLKMLDPEERDAREFGKWKHLAGLVYKELDRLLHIYEDFTVPESWMKVEAVDPHDARPTHWTFAAVSPEEFELFGKKRNRIYFFDTVLLTGTIGEMAKQVKSIRALHGYDHPSFVMLDKKMGQKTQIEGVSWEGKLNDAGIRNIRLSQSSPGDVEVGHKVVRAYLTPQFSALLDCLKPGMLFAKKGCGGPKGLIKSLFNYQYDEKSEKPREEFKDWADLVRYIALEQFTISKKLAGGWTPNRSRRAA